MRPAGIDPMVTSKNTTGFFGFGGRWCHSTAAAVADGGVGPAEMADPPDAIAVLGRLAPEASRRSEAQPATGRSSYGEGGRRGFPGSARVYEQRFASEASRGLHTDIWAPPEIGGPHVGGNSPESAS